jgi:hypothetical protein
MANRHTPEQREYIVRRLAAFYTPPDITAEFALRFPGVSCDDNDVLANDPTRFVVSPELFEAFKKERERVLLGSERGAVCRPDGPPDRLEPTG